MKRAAFALLPVLFFLSLTLSALAVADTDGPSANGSFQVSFEKGQSRNINFEAKVAQDGNVTGEIVLQDNVPSAPSPAATTNTEETEPLPPFYAKAKCDCLVVQGVEAVLSGTITESSRKSYIGRRVVLAVQDGDSLTPPLRDKLTYGFYSAPANALGASDLERPDEPGRATWVATDSERADDTGVIPQQSEQVTCTSFPISSFNFIGASQGKGKIKITR
jgi:hypothetical protein